MSHFSLHVLIPKPSDTYRGYESLLQYASGQADRLLAPFAEGLDVAPYQERCYCVGHRAKTEAMEQTTKEKGNFDSLRVAFKVKYPELAAIDYFSGEADPVIVERSRKVWQEEFSGPYSAFEKAAFEAHPLKSAIDPACEECKGSGSVESTYNPKSKWDWYSIGGRWNGDLIGHDPESDPENFEKCIHCDGTGTRADAMYSGPCNACGKGKGRALKFPSHQKNVGNVLPLSEFLPRHVDKNTPFAVLTPDGEWIERGSMGWWGAVSGEKDKEAWVEQVRSVYEKYPDTIVVLVDCHI